MKERTMQIKDMEGIFCDVSLVPRKFIKSYYLLTIDLMGTENIVSNSIMWKELNICISELGTREKDIICLYYGLYDANFQTIESIAEKYNLTIERIKQIIKSTIKKLIKERTKYSIVHRLELLKLKKGELDKEISYYKNIIKSDISVDITLKDFNLTDRTVNALNRAGIMTYEQLITLTPRQLMKIKYIGKKSLDEIWIELHGELFPILD